MPSTTGLVKTFTQSGAGQIWDSPSNIGKVDGLYGTVNLLPTEVSQTLDCTNIDYSNSVPPDATIAGIEINVRWYQTQSDGGSIRHTTFQMLKNGSVEGTNQSGGLGVTLPTTETTTTYGGASDLMGGTYTAADINSQLGVRVVMSAAALAPPPPQSGREIALIEWLTVTVYYNQNVGADPPLYMTGVTDNSDSIPFGIPA